MTQPLALESGNTPRRHGANTQGAGLTSLLYTAPPQLPFPTTAGFLFCPRLGASDTSVDFPLGHLQEHMGGKLDC